MELGTYSASASGFSLLQPLTVEVTVSEDIIETIEVTDNAETYPFLQAAKDKLIPRIIDNQSVKVDAIVGCTGSSSGIKLATEAALKEALAKAGIDESAIENFYTLPEKSTKQETIKTEVLVVGMGGSGSAAETMYVANGNDASIVNVLAIIKQIKMVEQVALLPIQWVLMQKNITILTMAVKIMLMRM